MYYRKDATIQNALGQALAGAHLYVCEQPVNLTTVPPGPLADVWFEPDGRFGIRPMPLVADSTGHFFYYAESDFYTEVFFWRGQLYKVLPDQAVGCVCGEGGGEGPVPWTFALQTPNIFGNPNPGALMLAYTAFTQQVFPPNFASPQSYGTVPPDGRPSTPQVFTIEVNEEVVGTVSLDSNGIFSFTTPGFVMNPGDRFELIGPDPVDPNLKDPAISLVGTRIT